MSKKSDRKKPLSSAVADYSGLLNGIGELLEAVRRAAARTVNSFMTATYWEIGRRIVEFEQGGEERAVYGESVILRLAEDLTGRFGKGFGKSNLFLMRKFYLASAQIFQTASGILADQIAGPPIFQTLSGISWWEKEPRRCSKWEERRFPRQCLGNTDLSISAIWPVRFHCLGRITFC